MKSRYPHNHGSQDVSAFVDVAGVPSYGDVYFVDSNGGGSADSNAGTKKNPNTTIQSAHDQAKAANGDTIVMAPGHAETISTAAGIALTKAGIRYVGTGRGSEMTTISFSATGSTLTQTGANCVYENIRFTGTIDALVAPLTISVANTTFINCEFVDTTTLNTFHWLTVTASGTGLTLINCRNKGTDTAGNTAFITMAAVEDVKIIGLVSQGDFSAANIDCSAAVIDILIDRCFLENLNGVDVNIEGFAASTGWISNCKCEIATDGEVTWISTPGEISSFENYGVNEAGETGMLIGTVSAT